MARWSPRPYSPGRAWVRLFLDSIGYRDYPVVMGILMFSATMVLIGSLLADIFYAVVDPRIRVG
ncbi:ABC-type dipeptide/oligopeptide/nickel transport system permease component [Bradyrhizobium sp. LM2.9]